MADDLRTRLTDIGPLYASDIRRYSQEVKDLYAPLLQAAVNEGITVQRDVPYGPDARQVLDVFRPSGESNADVVVFVHGGAFVRSAKSGPQGIYDNVLYWFAKQGFVGVNIEYRLAPGAAYPQGAMDVASALDWVHTHIAAHGGNPQRILLMGHSAGGTHAATYVADPAVERTLRAIALVLVSARLRADVSPLNPNADAVRAYYGDDTSTYETRSAVHHAVNCRIPVMVAIAQFEYPLLDVYGLEFALRIAQARNTAPRFVQCEGHNHMSVMAHFNAGEESLGREILAFWAGCA